MMGTMTLRDVIRFNPIRRNIDLRLSPILKATAKVMNVISRILARISCRMRRKGLGLKENNVDLEYDKVVKLKNTIDQDYGVQVIFNYYRKF